MATKATPKQNLPVAAAMTPEAIQAAMIEHGLIQPSAGGSDITRIKVSGNNFSIDDDIFAVYNPVKKDPAFVAQIVDKPAVMQRLWFTPELARLTGHDELLGQMGDKGTFCKSHEDDPNEALRISENGYECRACPVNGFVKADALPIMADGSKAKRCSLAAELDIRILDGDGALTDETVYTMTLSATALIEFRGSTSKKADSTLGYQGIVAKSRHDNDPRNFIHKLIDLGTSKGLSVPQILTAVRMGLVLAEVRSLPATNEQGSMNWNVLNLTPIDILDSQERTAIGTEEEPAAEPDTEAEGDAAALPF